MKKLILLALLSLELVSSRLVWAQDKPTYIRTEDVIYGRKFGTALTLDVFEPAKKNGAAVFWMVSGGFFSEHANIRPALFTPLLDYGYTVFAIVHGSQPRFIVPEIEEDIHRAIRFVRHNASRWGIDPSKFGISGTSAGGQLSLTLGTQVGPGKADAKDPVDRESSAVQAVACFYPPTDFLNWSKQDEDWMDFEPTRRFEPAFGPKGAPREYRKELGRKSPPLTSSPPRCHPRSYFRVTRTHSSRFTSRRFLSENAKRLARRLSSSSNQAPVTAVSLVIMSKKSASAPTGSTCTFSDSNQNRCGSLPRRWSGKQRKIGRGKERRQRWARRRPDHPLSQRTLAWPRFVSYRGSNPDISLDFRAIYFVISALGNVSVTSGKL